MKGSFLLSAEDEEKPELIVIQQPSEGEDGEERSVVEEPAKVMRIGTMIKQLLEEVRQGSLDENSRVRLREIYETSVRELAEGLSPDLREELDRLTMPFAQDGTPSESELRIAQAQLVGWLEGMFHGIQATLFAQQAAMRSQLEEMRRRGLPQGGTGGDGNGRSGGSGASGGTGGTYL